MSPRVVATPTMSAENCRRHNVADAVTGSLYLSHVSAYLRHDICEASAKLARWDRCLPMSSWASHDIAYVADMSRDIFMTRLHVGVQHVVWGGLATRHDTDISNIGLSVTPKNLPCPGKNIHTSASITMCTVPYHATCIYSWSYYFYTKKCLCVSPKAW
jgi:hypothetical protein